MRQQTVGRVISIPRPGRSVADYSDGYRNGLLDGERWANTIYVWLGAGIGIMSSVAVLLVVLFYYPGYLR